MHFHKPNNSNEILSKLEARLIEVKELQRYRINILGNFSSPSFQGAEIAKGLIQLHYLWYEVFLSGHIFFSKCRYAALYRNYLEDEKVEGHILIATNNRIKLKRILISKDWGQSSVKVRAKRESTVIANRENLYYSPLFAFPFRVIDMKWNKL